MGRARDLIERFRMFAPPNKELGQHFLLDDEVLRNIADLGGLNSDDYVLEVGPGPGGLTNYLIEMCENVICVEIDERAITHLEQVFKEGITIIKGDVLTTQLPRFNKVVANIPYQISSPLLEKLCQIHRNEPIEKMVLLVQEEFAQRMKMDNPIDRCSLGMNLQLEWDIQLQNKVSPHHFSPAPKVDSRVVTLTPRKELLNIDNRLARMIIHQAFNQRRKKLRNSLANPPKRLNRIKGWHRTRWEDALHNLEGLNRRPEELTLDDWVHLTDQICEVSPSEG